MKNRFVFTALTFSALFITACSGSDDNLAPVAQEPIKPDPPVVVAPPVAVPAATFTDFSPKNAYLGDVITIYGTNLDKNLKLLSASIGGVETTITSATSTSATVIIPDDLNSESAKITLTTAGQETPLVSKEDFHLNAPVISSISYSKGFAGQQVTIKGKGFRNSYHIGQVSFNGADIEASLTNVGNTEVSMSVPKGLPSGKYPISVTIAGMKATASDLFEIIVPTITAITPTTGAQYTKMTITGTNLKDIYGIGVPTIVSFTDAATNTGSTTGTIWTSEENKIVVDMPRLLEGHTYKVRVLVVRSQVEAPTTFTYKK
ncbi:hypothetical protein D0817_02290 [Flavobacterium cupreum]|uniref:IPT/TIG domain-containing protein n=1 Tax=Flavobacterium cupreum TaxID=2133766 RepID=A0A434ADN7_9FLAO|nr:IPT/TIG domain-containing protein [Flavobacterium cupreum]RUT72456.1 hypothetical protein D0817_02290 [Flavobacterium cupreum]